MRLWHDDIREPPDGWAWARTNRGAQFWLSGGDVTEVSLDHDMGLDHLDPSAPGAPYLRGYGEHDGMELVRWMCETRLVPPVVEIHSHNHVAAVRMAGYLRQWAETFDHDVEVTVCPWSPGRVDSAHGQEEELQARRRGQEGPPQGDGRCP